MQLSRFALSLVITGIVWIMRLVRFISEVGWNMLLAVIPVVLAYLICWMLNRSKQQRRVWTRLFTGLLAVCWLAFLPNSCYLLSEWRHFLPTGTFIDLYLNWKEAGSKEAILWLFADTLFYFCYTTFGMLTFTLAIRPMARLAKSRGYPTTLLAVPLFLLVSLGVFLGLMKRLNSWDLVTDPGVVWNKVVVILHRPWDLGFIAAFAAFLWLAFLVTDIWIDGFRLRWKQIKG